MSISVNLYRNYKRKLSIRQKIVGISLSLEENDIDIPSGEQMTEEMIVKQEACLIIQKSVKQLPNKYKLPILLFYMEDLEIMEVSQILNLPEGTVKSSIHRAKKILKQKLEDIHYER